MIARIWHGAVTADKAAEYLRRMREIALPDYRATPGNIGGYVLQRPDGNITHFYMLTFRESEEAIAAFAGKPIEVAKYYDFDPDFLIEMEPDATHYQVYDR